MTLGSHEIFFLMRGSHENIYATLTEFDDVASAKTSIRKEILCYWPLPHHQIS